MVLRKHSSLLGGGRDACVFICCDRRSRSLRVDLRDFRISAIGGRADWGGTPMIVTRALRVAAGAAVSSALPACWA